MNQKYEHTILAVDDEVAITKSLKRLFHKTEFTLYTANSGQEGLDILQKASKPFSLIISDQRMPGMTGAQFLEKSKAIVPDAIRFLLTGYSDMDAIIDAINKGEIHKYITKPWDVNDLILQVRQALKQYELVLENRRLSELTAKQNKELFILSKGLQEKVRERTREIEQKNKELEGGMLEITKLISTLVESLDSTAGRYMRDVSRFSRMVGESYGMDEDTLDHLEIAGMIQDIGLLGNKQLCFKKEEDLEGEEQKIFNEHTLISKVCIETVKRLKPVGEIVYHHHENYDGSGFPDKLKGEEIPLASRILSVVSDYFRLIGYDYDVEKHLREARKIFGTAMKSFMITDPELTIHEIAKKTLLLNANEKYDLEVLTKFIKIMDTEVAAGKVRYEVKQVSVDELEEGMVLAKNLRSRTGTILVTKRSKLDQKTIRSIRELSRNNAVEESILILTS